MINVLATLTPIFRDHAIERAFRFASTRISVVVSVVLIEITAFALMTQVGAMGFRPFILSQDFRALYTAGTMIQTGVGAEFYDLNTQYESQRAWAPELDRLEKLMPFLSPPFAALPLAVVAALPVERAYLAWLSMNLVIGIMGLALLSRPFCDSIRGHGRIYLLAFAFLPATMALVQGQLSFWLVLIFALGWRALRQGHEVIGGALLTLLAIKPYLVVVPLLTLLVSRRWKALGGMVIGAVALMLISVYLVSPRGLVGYIGLAQAAASWGDAFTVHPKEMHTLRGAIQALLDTNEAGPALLPWALVSTVLLAAALWILRRPAPPGAANFDAQMAAILLVGLLVSPHGNLHDLSLLGPVLLLTGRWWTENTPRLNWLTWLGRSVFTVLYFSPWLAFLWGPILGVTPTILAMALAALTLLLSLAGAQNSWTGTAMDTVNTEAVSSSLS
ncbi:MAG: glycosyltransferase family 87 protein [Chloroflexota bacterium]